MSDEPKVYASMSAVQGELAAVGVAKLGKNQQQGFKYRAWDDVQQALAPILAKHKLIVVPRIETRTESVVPSKSGGQIFRVALSGKIACISGVDGSQIEFGCVGEAMDSGDKATSKALTMFMKYGILHAFCIPLEGVADADAETHEAASEPFISPPRVSELLALVLDSGSDLQKFVNYLGVPSLERLPVSRFDEALAALRRKQEVQK